MELRRPARSLALIGIGSFVLFYCARAQELPLRDDPQPRPVSRATLDFDLRGLRLPGYTLPRMGGQYGGVRAPAKDTRALLLKSTRKTREGRAEPRQIQVVLVAAQDSDQAWESLTLPVNGFFYPRDKRLDRLVTGDSLEADRVGHGPMALPSNYTVAATRGWFGAAVRHVAGGSLLTRPVSDTEIRLVEAVLRFLLEWASASWAPAKKPKIRPAALPRPLRLRDGEGKEFAGLESGFDSYVAVQALAKAIGATCKWDAFTEVVEVASGSRVILLSLNSNSWKDGDAQRTLYRPVRWFRGQCWVSVEDARRLFGRRLRVVRTTGGTPQLGDRVALLDLSSG